jgi:predicted nuclease of predicted toxin-antitoxin system
LIDMPLSPRLATWLVDLGHDAVHAGAVGLSTAPDTEIIEVARREDRTIVTADLDYPRLLASTRSAEPSLILFRGGSWSEADVRTRLASILTGLTVDDMSGSIIVVERERFRRRRLPLI